MIEFSEDLSTVYSGKEAIRQRVETRLKHTTDDIPYYTRGVDVAEFQYGSQIAAIRLAFRDFGPDITYDAQNSRIQAYNIEINVDNLGEE